MTKKAEPELLVLSVALAWPVERYRDRLPSRLHRGQGVMDTEARAQEGVRTTPQASPKTGKPEVLHTSGFTTITRCPRLWPSRGDTHGLRCGCNGQ